jgi:hypothetical protein
MRATALEYKCRAANLWRVFQHDIGSDLCVKIFYVILHYKTQIFLIYINIYYTIIIIIVTIVIICVSLYIIQHR